MTPSRSRSIVGIETDRGPWVQALIAAGYTVYAVNPLQASRYRERHGTSGAKSDPGDAHVLAELVRLDRDHHRPIAGDSDVAEHVKVLARAHQSLVWSRQRQTNTLRSMLREYYPAALAAFDEPGRSGRAGRAGARHRPRPTGRALTVRRVERLAENGGRQRNLTATAERIVGRAAQRAARSPPRRGDRLRAPASARWSPSSASWSARPRCCRARWRRVLAGTRTLRST